MRVSAWFALLLLLSGVLLQHNSVLAQTNTPPTLTSIGTITGAFEDSSFYVQGVALFNNANEADADGNPLTFRIEEVLTGTLKYVDGTAIVPGSSTVTANQNLSWTPPSNVNGVIAAFSVVAFDGTDVSSTPVTVNINVAPFDDTPTLDPFPQSTTIAEDSGPLVVNLTGITSGAPNENQPLTVTATVKGVTGAPSVMLTASVDYTSPQSTGTLTITPAANQFGGATVTVTVSDGHTPSPNYPRTDIRLFNVTVTSVNDAPTLDALPDLTVNEDSGPVAVDLSGITSGASNENQFLSVSASIAFPPYILTSPTIPVTYTSPQTTGKLTLNLIANASGSAPVSVRVSDGNLTTTRTFNLTVAAVNDPPTLTTMNPLRSTNEDQPYNVTFNALTFEGNETDIDGPSMSFRIEQVLTGTMTQNGQPIVPGQTLVTSTTSVLWIPPANQFGDIAAFTVRAWDGVDASATPIIVLVRVNSINDPPPAQPQTLSGNEDTPIPFTLPDRDADGDVVTYTFFDLNGATVSGTAPNFTYTSAPNRTGAVFFTFRGTDGVLSTNFTRIDVNLSAVNDAPTLTTMNPLRSTNEDQPYNVTFNALTFEGNETDIDGPSMSFRIEQVLTGTMTQNGQPIVPGQTFVTSTTSVLWTPPANQFGDIAAFTVRAWDGVDASATPIIVLVRVNSINDPPPAQPQTLTTDEDTPVGFILPDRDVDGDTLTYTFTELNGATVTGTAPNFTFTPPLNRYGTGSFVFRASDGVLSSNFTRINVNVTSVNDAPTLTTVAALPGTEDSVRYVNHFDIVQNADEADIEAAGAPVAFRIEEVLVGTLTKNGQLVVPGETILGINETLVWTPPLNANGLINAFTIKAWDGALASATAVLVPVQLAPRNDAPVPQFFSDTTPEDTALNFTPNATDVDGDTLTFTIVQTPDPLKGTITGTSPNFTFTPAPNFVGTAGFVYSVSDGTVTINNIGGLITVTAVNDAPIAHPALVTADEDVFKSIALAADDAENDDLTFTIVEQPQHGFLDGVAPNVVYVPNANYNGPDSFSFKVTDGTEESNIAVVSLTVTPVNDAPWVDSVYPIGNEDTQISVTLNASDIDGDALTYSVVNPPQHGSISGTAPNLTYTPDAHYYGADIFTYKANDGTVDSNLTIVAVTIEAVNDAPTAASAGIETNEDTAKTLKLGATDIDADALTYSIVDAPAHGTLTGTAPNLTYTPNANYNGADSFSFKVSDGTEESNIAVVSLTVASANDAPVANSASVNGNEDNAVGVTLSGSDGDGDTVTYSVIGVPQHGSISGISPNLTYTPDANYNGTDSFTFKVNDGTTDSNTATISINIGAVNDLPAAVSKSATTDEDTATDITLSGGDADGDTLTYRVTQTPQHGTLSGTAPNLTYTPNANYNGADSFAYVVNDGIVDSAQATVTINVTAVNDAPTLTSIQVLNGALEDEIAGISYAALQSAANEADVDNTSITFRIESLDSGTLTKNGEAVAVGTTFNADDTLEWTPPANTNGPLTAFSVKAWDGELASAQAIAVKIQVDAVSDTPVANGQSVNTDEDVAVGIALGGSDVDGDALTYSIVQAPEHGTLAGTAPNLTYTPDADYNGTDSFTFIANDGALDSAAATVSITIAAKNDAPVAQNQSASTNEDTAKTLTLGATDVDGDELTYSIVTPPAHGALTGTAPNLTYTPGANYNGADSFTFRANDGNANSNTATVSLNVIAQNDAPVAAAATSSATEDTAKTLTLSGSDLDGDALSYAIVQAPAHGTLSGTAPNLTYTPAANYNGSDSFTFKVNDGTADSATATISLNVAAVNDAPVAQNASVTTGVGTAVGITLGASDVEGTALTYTIVSGPTRGTLSGSGAQRTYTPNAGFIGTDSFTFRVNDGTVNSNVATVTITVQLINRAPVLTSVNTLNGGLEDTSLTITYATLAAAANESDADGNTIRFRIESVVSGTLTKNGTAVTPGSTLLANGESLVWKPAANANGTLTAFGIRAWDGSLASASEVPVKVNVTAVNDAPSFNLSGTSITVAKNAAAQTRTAWAINLSDGPTDESSQTLSFTVTSSSTSLFSSQPAISSNGTLTFTPAKNKTGTATVSVRLQDSGGTANGGVNTSAVQTFTIKVG